MLRDVASVTPLDDYRLRVQFDDGIVGVVDITRLVRFDGVFAPLRSEEYFRRVAVHPELGVVFWPNGADLDSDVLYSEITGAPLPASQAAR
jgi:hypothetical protein